MKWEIRACLSGKWEYTLYMGERFKIPRVCIYCKKLFVGRDKAGVIARYCSRACHFRNTASKEKSSKAGKIGAQKIIEMYRGTGTKTYIKEYGKHQHRVVMENKVGRKLTKDEIVHHIDHNKHNNNIENLQLVTRAEHAKIHFSKTNASSGKDH